MQVQAGDDGHGRADGLAHARQQLAFAVVQVLGDHGAVQVQVDGVVAAFARRFDDLAGDALIGVGGDVGGRLAPAQITVRTVWPCATTALMKPPAGMFTCRSASMASPRTMAGKPSPRTKLS